MTVESFKAWKEKFEEEMREKKGRQKEDTTTSSGRLTGELTPPSGCGLDPPSHRTADV